MTTSQSPQFTIPERGFWVRFCEVSEADPYGHLFCGEHSIPGAWCTNCDAPLLRVLSLDLTDPRLGELAVLRCSQLHLLYCSTCNRQSHPSFLYSFDDRGDVTVIRTGKKGKLDGFPYANYPAYFPARAIRLVPLTAREQQVLYLMSPIDKKYDEQDALFEELPHGSEGAHQLGGRPWLIQDFWLETCRNCNAKMSMLAAIANDSGSPPGFTDNTFAQMVFHLCPTCRIVSVRNICD